MSKTEIIPGIRSDHSAITLSIKPTKGNKTAGPSFWKFNNSLLKNQDFASGLTTYIEGEIKKECAPFENKQVKWEYMKYKIKTWSINKSKEIAKNKSKKRNISTRKYKKSGRRYPKQPQ